ncbi:discoidin domain-containing protein [Luteolibacter sp. SL250]|uniref:DUF7133 domain-containing protein n=1 Tax=Luteolibacter sp. SL250 TaxID=2995170 RepID=UPI00226DE0AF|nr:discoidin domain-containing protein [Luteolibacter sp. SL250]WAC20881.1 discoidin domain-containing protein [Luteolibacter sp. SL250]
MRIHLLIPPLTALSVCLGQDANFPAMPPVEALSPQEAASSFEVPDGYRMQLMLSEPQIAEPVATVFDGNGRMFVAEMRTYMQDIDGNGQMEKTSRISMHADEDGDGTFEKHTVFAEGLLLPRMMLPLGKGQLVINETNSNDLFLLTDENGDGVADKKEIWYRGGPRGGNLEHQPSGLVWALDNAIYTTLNSIRLRWTPDGIKKEETKPNGGQWGLGQDDLGNLWFVNASGERGPNTFQASPVYGMFNPPEQFDIGFKEVFPLVGARDFQGGPSRVREPDGTLTGFTACAGIDVYRGDQLPRELLGNVFFGEPVGRLVRRTVVTNDGGLKVLSNPYQRTKSEFLRSTDLCFRPVNFTNAPDGTLYITDMYRGIIQEGNWVRPGSYLRKAVEQYQFDKVSGHGRIWRLEHKDTRPVKQPRMYDETSAQLTAHLSHPNGWWRDTAQRLLVLRQDKTVVPVLENIVRSEGNPFARIHALWTLQGLGALTPQIIRGQMADADPQIRTNAIRVSETLFLNGDSSFQKDIQNLAKDPDPAVTLQGILTAKYLAWPDHMKFIQETVEGSSAKGVTQIGRHLLQGGQNQAGMSDQQRLVMKKGQEIYNSVCAACHGMDGKGSEIAGLKGAMLAPPFVGSKIVNNNPNGGIYVLLKGLEGEIEGKKYEGLMIPMGGDDDEWIASVMSYIRNSFGNRGSFIQHADVAQARKDTASRTTPWTYQELMDRLPQYMPASQIKVSASEKSGDAVRAVDESAGSRYTTGKFMLPGMWFQVELTKPVKASGIILDTRGSVNDYPRGTEVSISDDGKTWRVIARKPEERNPLTEISFTPVTTRFIRVTQLGSAKGNFWSIHDLKVLQAPAKRP